MLCQSLCFGTEKCFLLFHSALSKVLEKKSDNAAHILFWKGQEPCEAVFSEVLTPRAQLKQALNTVFTNYHQVTIRLTAVPVPSHWPLHV